MSAFEAQCDCELDSPGTLSHLPVEDRLKAWKIWALYLKRRIETHYRPAIAELDELCACHLDGCKRRDEELEVLTERLDAYEAENERLQRCGNCSGWVFDMTDRTTHICMEIPIDGRWLPVQDADPCHHSPSRWQHAYDAGGERC